MFYVKPVSHDHDGTVRGAFVGAFDSFKATAAFLRELSETNPGQWYAVDKYESNTFLCTT